MIDNIKSFFELSSNYLQKILEDEDVRNELIELLGNINVQIENNSVSYIIYHENEFYNNSYQIKSHIIYDKKRVGYYILYIDENNNFIDEFFVLD